jgi:hypothetical protein
LEPSSTTQLNLLCSPAQKSRSPSPEFIPSTADIHFGKCVTPTSFPSSPLLGLTGNVEQVETEPVARFTPLVPCFSSSSSSSSSEDETSKAKRLKIDPDYVPSVTSEGTLTATNSQEGSEVEDIEKDETETEEEESWHPSGSTSPEVISSPEDD